MRNLYFGWISFNINSLGGDSITDGQMEAVTFPNSRGMILGSAVTQLKSACLGIKKLLFQALPASLYCYLEQDTVYLNLYCFNPGRPVPT